MFKKNMRGAYSLIGGQLKLPTAGEKVFSYLNSRTNFGKKIIVTPYHWPDIDGIASAYALSELLKHIGYEKSNAMIWEKPQFEAQWAMDKLSLNIPQLICEGEEDFILVDASDPADIPAFIPASAVKVIIDHREYSDVTRFQNAISWIDTVGSAATLVATLYYESKFTPSEKAASLIYLAIMSNTIRCKTHNTTELDKAALAWVKSQTNLKESIVDEMFQEKSNIPNIYQAIENDTSSKSQNLNGKKTAVGQLEIVNAEQFLNENYEEITQALHEIKIKRDAEAIFLILVDINLGKTFFIFLDNDIQNLISKCINLVDCKTYSSSDDIFIRKEVIALADQVSSIASFTKNA